MAQEDRLLGNKEFIIFWENKVKVSRRDVDTTSRTDELDGIEEKSLETLPGLHGVTGE